MDVLRASFLLPVYLIGGQVRALRDWNRACLIQRTKEEDDS